MNRNRLGKGACRLLGVLLLLATGLVPVRLAANPLDNYGFGSRWVAMGGAVTALVDDVGALYYNPAGLVHPDNVQASIGYFYASQQLEINGRDIGEDSVSGVVAGFVTPPMHLGGSFKLAGGGALYLPDKRVARSLAIPYDQPTFIQFGSRNQRLVSMFPFSLEILPWLSIGTSISMYVRTSGGPDFILRENRPDNEGIYSEGSISTSQRPAFFFTAGMQVHPTDRLHLGFCWRGKNEILYKIPLKVHIEPLHVLPNMPFPLLGESLIDMDSYIYTFFSPEQYSFAVGYDWGENLTLGLELIWARWSAFRQPAPEGATYFYGGIAQIVPPNPNYPLPTPNFSDVLIPAVGAEYRVVASRTWDIFVRGGYRYRPSPAPEASGWNNFLDNDTHIFSAGLGFNLLRTVEVLKVIRGPVRLDIHGQYFWLEEATALKENPVADAYGDMTFGGKVLVGGATLTLEF